MHDKDNFHEYMKRRSTVFDGDDLKLPLFCESVLNARKWYSEILILNEIPNFLEGNAYRTFGETAPLYNTVDLFINDLCSWVCAQTVQSGRAILNQIQQKFNESPQDYGLRCLLFEGKILSIHDLSLKMSPEQASKSWISIKRSIKREALEGFLRGLVSFPRERILAENVKSLEEAVRSEPGAYVRK